MQVEPSLNGVAPHPQQHVEGDRMLITNTLRLASVATFIIYLVSEKYSLHRKFFMSTYLRSLNILTTIAPRNLVRVRRCRHVGRVGSRTVPGLSADLDYPRSAALYASLRWQTPSIC